MWRHLAPHDAPRPWQRRAMVGKDGWDDGQQQVVHTSSFTLPFESKNYTNNLNPTTLLLPNSFFPDFQTEVPTNALKSLLCLSSKRRSHSKRAFPTTTTHASLLEAPVLWAGRLCIFYALLKAGLAGSQSNPLVSGLLQFKYTLLLDNGVHLFATFSGFFNVKILSFYIKLFNFLIYFILLCCHFI